MLISRQKLRPGSGCISVRVSMDGPIRVIELVDIQQRVRAFYLFFPLSILSSLVNMKGTYRQSIPATKAVDVAISMEK